jgi:hypothetical protein
VFLFEALPAPASFERAAARNLLLRYLVDGVFDVGREIDRAGCADAYTGRDVRRQRSGRARQPYRQVGGDLGYFPVLRIDLDDASAADLGNDQLAVA